MITLLRNSALRQTTILLALTTPVLTAQAKPAAILPANPLATLHIDGPAALRAAFLPTNLGKLFAGPEFKDMVAPFMQMIEAAKERGGDQLPFDPNELEKAIYGYGGRLSIAFHILTEDIDFTAPEPPDFAVTIVLTPDGKTDLPALCKKCEELANKMHSDDLAEIEFPSKTITFVEQDGDPGPCLPFMHKDHLVLIVSQNMKEAASMMLLADAKTPTPRPGFSKSSIGASIDLQKVIAILKEGGAQNGGPMWDAIGNPVVTGLGADSLQSLELTYRAQGPAVVSEVTLNFNQQKRGIVGALFPADAKRSPLIDVLPRNAVMASVSHFDLKKVYAGVKSIFEQIGDNAPMSLEDVEDRFQEHYGLRLNEDLIGLFGNSVIAVQMESIGEARPSVLSAADGLCLGFAVNDAAKLMKSLDTILRKDGLHAGRKKDDYKGIAVYNINPMMMMPLTYASSDRLFLLGLGESGGDAVRAILDEEKNHAAGEEPAPLPKEIANRVTMVPAGWVGLGWSDLENQFGNILDQLEMVADQLPPEIDMVTQILEKLPPLFKNYKVKHQVAVVRSNGNQWVYQNIW